MTVFAASGQSWDLNGNAGTNLDINFLGTTDKKPLVLRTNNIERFRITQKGYVGVGIHNPQQRLDVNGNINIANGFGFYINYMRVLHLADNGNIFVGEFAGDAVVSGAYNTGLGYAALYSNNSGQGNAALGNNSLFLNTAGYNNTACGSNALLSNDSGFNNTAGGYAAMFSNTTGYQNTALGYNALSANTSGGGNTVIGAYADVNNSNYQNSSAFGTNSLLTASNQVRIGNEQVTSIGGYTDWTKISDGRVKKNIKQNVPGLSFINKLNPVTYNLDLNAADKIVQRPSIKDKHRKIIQPTKEDVAARTAKEKILYTGFVAQDVEKAAKELNYDFSGVDAPKNDKDLYGLRYSEFVVPLVSAVQELSKQNDSLQQNVNALQTQIDELRNTVKVLVNNSNNTNMISGSITSSNLIKIYPIPVESVLNIEFNGNSAQKARVNMYNVNGKLLLSKSAVGSTQLDLKQLAAGTYLIKLNDENGRELYSGKVIKQH